MDCWIIHLCYLVEGHRNREEKGAEGKVGIENQENREGQQVFLVEKPASLQLDL